MTLCFSLPGPIVARASSPASSGGVSPRESSPQRNLAARRCGNPQPGRLRCQNSRPSDASISSRHRHALKALHNSAQGWRACEPTLGHMPQLYPPFGRGGSGRGGSQTGDQSPFMLLHLPAPRHVPGEYKMRFMIFFSHLEKWQRKSYR